MFQQNEFPCNQNQQPSQPIPQPQMMQKTPLQQQQAVKSELAKQPEPKKEAPRAEAYAKPVAAKPKGVANKREKKELDKVGSTPGPANQNFIYANQVIILPQD